MYQSNQTYSATEELKSLPRYYPYELAKKNNDIIVSSAETYNIDRLYTFLKHTKDGTPDRVRINIYGIDGPVTLAILEYDGDLITYTVDTSRYNNDSYITYKGPYILVEDEVFSNHYLKTFYFIAENGLKMRMFSYRELK